MFYQANAVESLSARRAWIEICNAETVKTSKAESLSARRAWIEIVITAMTSQISVTSLSARRAWIEIKTRSQPSRPRRVALRKESVDRNLWWGVRKAVGSLSLSARRAWIEIRKRTGKVVKFSGRSPQGERG